MSSPLCNCTLGVWDPSHRTDGRQIQYGIRITYLRSLLYGLRSMAYGIGSKQILQSVELEEIQFGPVLLVQHLEQDGVHNHVAVHVDLKLVGPA